jgi:tRNA pseudouridine65 synthase
MSELEVLYRDDRYIAVNKPAGMLVHRTALDRHEAVFCLQQLRDQLGREVFPVHRLDKPTSGILLFALDKEALKEASQLFSADRVHKTYLALVRGWLEGSGVIDHPLAYPEGFGPRRGGDRPQEAVTEYRLGTRYELAIGMGRHPTTRYSLVELSPKTGRIHQIRRHLKHLSHPVIGDTRYGDGRHNRLFRDELGCHRLLLMASELAFPHPCSGKDVRITAPMDPDFAEVLLKLPVVA